MSRISSKSSLLLLLAALIWGFAFVAQSVGTEYVGAFTFNASRFMIGGIVLLPCVYLLSRGKKDTDEGVSGKETLKGGVLCGIALFAASSLQQAGIAYTTVGKAGFITSMYIVMVPVLGIFLGRKTGWNLWVSVLTAVIGLYMLCISGEFSIGPGDGMMFICAIFFSVQIMLVDHFSPLTGGIKLSCVEFFVCGVLSLICMVIFETPDISAIFAAGAPILYAGVLSCGVAYTCQAVAQKNTDPRLASLIMSLESVFSVIGGWMILGEAMSARELFGCALIFAAVLLAQFSPQHHPA